LVPLAVQAVAVELIERLVLAHLDKEAMAAQVMELLLVVVEVEQALLVALEQALVFLAVQAVLELILQLLE
jgi:hypothetical protein